MPPPIIKNFMKNKTTLTDDDRRALGLVCGRLYSPAWLIARARRNERAGRPENFDYPAPKRGEPLGTSVLPANFAL